MLRKVKSDRRAKPIFGLFDREKLAAGAMLVSAAFHAAAALGQDADQSAEQDVDLTDWVIVTAQKREARAQDVPMSITTLNEAALRDIGAATLTGVEYVIPNLSVQHGNGSNFTTFAIRGIGFVPRNIGFDSGFGVYVDGAFLGRQGAFEMDLVDVERVEVLRGPQGTLFGRNNITGVLNVTTVAPQPEFGGRVIGTLGNYGRRDVQGMLNIPVANDTLALRVSAARRRQHGVVENALADDLGEIDLVSGRVRLRGEWGGFSADLFVDGLRDRGTAYIAEALTGLGHDAAPEPRSVAMDQSAFQMRDIVGGALKLDHRFANGFELTSITTLRDQDVDTGSDEDRGPLFLASTVRFRDTEKLVAQEIRLASPEEKRLDFIVGAYLQHSDASTDRLIIAGAPIGGGQVNSVADLKTNAYAVFGHFNLDLTERLGLNGGLRFTKEEKSFDFHQTNSTFALPIPALLDVSGLEHDGDNLSPEIGATFAPGDDVMLYSRIARGFKAGGFNADLVSSVDNLEFGAEKLTNYEIGAKTTLFDGRMLVNMAVFRIDYTDMQVNQFDAATNTIVIQNAGKSRSQGFELEFLAKPDEFWTLTGGVGYADAQFVEFIDVGGEDRGGHPLPEAPNWTASFAALFESGPFWRDVSFFARGEVSYRGRSHFNGRPEPESTVGGFALVNARLGIRSDAGWSITVWGKNIFDEEYLHFRNGTPDLFGQTTGNFGDPALYGVDLVFEF